MRERMSVNCPQSVEEAHRALLHIAGWVETLIGRNEMLEMENGVIGARLRAANRSLGALRGVVTRMKKAGDR